MRQPDFDNLLKVLRRERPDRPTLFEFFLNEPLYRRLAGPELSAAWPEWTFGRLNPMIIGAFANAGYDYATCFGADMLFPVAEHAQAASVSVNDLRMLSDAASVDSYPWPDPDSRDYAALDQARQWLPDGMKLIVFGPGGVLENVTALVGYDALCLLLADDPTLAERIFHEVGSRLVRYYERCAAYDTVGALIGNDDWGFKTQPMLSPADMRRYVIPWHRRIVAAMHAADKPAILHSCGRLDLLMDDIIDDIGYDAKHSYEDTITPVEDAYEQWGDRIAILGGIDLDYVCTRTPAEVTARGRGMFERSAERGGYALGTGNSVPEYVPEENYLALLAALPADDAPPCLA